MLTQNQGQGFLPRTLFQALLEELVHSGYRCVGPRVRDGAIIYDPLKKAEELPEGISDHQTPGNYRLSTQDHPRCFAWAHGPQALKPFLFAPRESLWKAVKDGNGQIGFTPAEIKQSPLAIIGVRACDLAALKLQDQHFMEGMASDPAYTARRKDLFLVAVNCTHPSETCFCASTGDGPRATHSYDLVLSELDEGYIVQGGTEQGRKIMAQLPLEPITRGQLEYADYEIEQAARRQQRSLPGRNLRNALFAHLEHPRWAEVAARCLSCANCTSVCPTCFCHSENVVPSLEGTSTDHVREWDSCFTSGHSYIHGMTIRPDTRTRYRQWLTHKLGSWHDQYGRSGCVGCGRCITWCPVGIDITEEAAVICHES